MIAIVAVIAVVSASLTLVDAGGFCYSPYILMAPNEKCYYFSSFKTNWHLAVEHCRKLGGVLAAPATQQLAEELEDYIRNNNIGESYVGGTDLGHDGRWVWEADFSEMNLPEIWASGEPDNKKELEHCMSVGGGTEKGYSDVACRKNASFVCEKVAPPCKPHFQAARPSLKSSQCPSRFKKLMDGRCYFFSTNAATYDEARAKCSDFGGTLAEPTTSEKAFAIQEHILEEFPKRTIFFGAKSSSDGTWQFESSEEPVELDFWSRDVDKNAPNRCMASNEQSTHHWIPVDCNQSYFYICSWGAG